MKVLINGTKGRMVQEIAHYLHQHTANTTLIGQVSKHSPAVKSDGIATYDATNAPWGAADIIIDFTLPEGLLSIIPHCIQHHTAIVTGTTGLSPQQQTTLTQAAQQLPIVQSFNMSLGVNLLAVLVEQAAAALDESFDIEINELHHRHKKDAPSGTALLLGRAAATGRHVSLEEKTALNREGERQSGDIGFSVMRGGGVIGDHTVMLAGENERLELSHRGHNRSIYAQGAVKAAHWLQTGPKAPGLYSMRDVLELERS